MVTMVQRVNRTSRLGWFLVLAGIIYLSLPVIATFEPLAMVRIGNLEVSGISEFSAINTFIGLALVGMGIFVNIRRNVF